MLGEVVGNGSCVDGFYDDVRYCNGVLNDAYKIGHEFGVAKQLNYKSSVPHYIYFISECQVFSIGESRKMLRGVFSELFHHSS